LPLYMTRYFTTTVTKVEVMVDTTLSERFGPFFHATTNVIFVVVVPLCYLLVVVVVVVVVVVGLVVVTAEAN